MMCCFGCLFGGQSNKTGGSYIVQLVEDDRGKTQGIFYVRGKVKAAAPQVQVKESQKKMLQIIRDLVK